MWRLILLPFALQAIVIFLDEIIFHLRRGLPRWERIGHPLDTFTVLICMFFVLWVPFSALNLKIYCGLAIFSSLFITKDEFVHKHHCPWQEHWLHSLLFILHPITLAGTGLIWPIVQKIESPSWLTRWLDHPEQLHLFLMIQTGAMTLFFLYQTLFWNFLWKNLDSKEKTIL